MCFVIKKRTVLILVFALVLVVSAYLMFLGDYPNVVYERELNSVDLEKVSAQVEEGDNQEPSLVVNLENDFFIDYKLERDRLRGQEADYLRELINNPNASAESKEKAQKELIKLSQKVEKEMIVENLIRAKGFEDAVIFFSDDHVNVVVKTDGLQQKDIAQITDIVTKTASVPVDKITIIERK